MTQTFIVNNAPLELLDVGELAIVHNGYKKIDTWIVDTFFPNRPSFEQRFIPVGELAASHEIAPLVAPIQQGKPFLEDAAYQVDFVKPAYYKPKNRVAYENAFDEALVSKLKEAGVVNNVNKLTINDKLVIAQVAVMKRNHDGIDNAVQLSAIDLLINGKYILESDDYGRNLIDYRRDPSLNFKPAIPWDQPNATPVKDINEMASRLADADGGAPVIALTTSSVFSALLANAEFNNTFIKPYAGISVPFAPTLSTAAAQFRGNIGSVQFWTYDATYRTKAGVKRFIPRSYFGLISDVQGSVAQGEIQNINAGGAAVKYFDRQWYQEDVSSVMLMTESAPLVVPSNKNGVVGGLGFLSDNSPSTASSGSSNTNSSTTSNSNNQAEQNQKPKNDPQNDKKLGG